MPHSKHTKIALDYREAFSFSYLHPYFTHFYSMYLMYTSQKKEQNPNITKKKPYCFQFIYRIIDIQSSPGIVFSRGTQTIGFGEYAEKYDH